MGLNRMNELLRQYRYVKGFRKKREKEHFAITSHERQNASFRPLPTVILFASVRSFSVLTRPGSIADVEVADFRCFRFRLKSSLTNGSNSSQGVVYRSLNVESLLRGRQSGFNQVRPNQLPLFFPFEAVPSFPFTCRSSSPFLLSFCAFGGWSEEGTVGRERGGGGSSKLIGGRIGGFAIDGFLRL